MKSLFAVLWGYITGRRVEFLKCDTKGCPYIEFHTKLNQGHVGRSCPSCASNLMNQEDFDKFSSERN